MAQRYCEVALPVPLRSTFVYAVPSALNGEAIVGRRVVVPFRNRPMIGMALAESNQPPDASRVKSSIKEVAEVMDPVPALPPKLIELGLWISRYYLAPIGEAFRAMLPPEIELRHDREYALTEAGRAASGRTCRHSRAHGHRNRGTRIAAPLRERAANRSIPPRLRRIPGGEPAAEQLVRRGYLASREVVRHRKARMQKIVAWNPHANAGATCQRRPLVRPKRKFAKFSPPRAVRCRSAFARRKGGRFSCRDPPA